MKMMVTHNMVTGIPSIVPPNGICKECMLGKHHQEPFDLGKAWCARNRLELVHSDLCCVNKHSLVGAKYIMTLVDEFSRFAWVYFLKNKIQVLKFFRKLGNFEK